MEHFDVLIVGAGLSGIGASVHLSEKRPEKTFAIVEAREAIGGTWDLFRYPGIRSDSDMYTLGYSFRPWTGDKAIADGPAILEYIRETARERGIDRKIRFGHRVTGLSWSTERARWTVSIDRPNGEKTELSCSFLVMCTGYYDYAGGYMPDYPGVDRFRGRVVHPQEWTSDIDYEGKRVVVIGSGATAVTLVPELAKKAAHVTMLQRSPTYIMSLPSVDKIAKKLRARLPGEMAYGATRLKNVALSTALYNFCRAFPERAHEMMLSGVRARLGPDYDVATHFTPKYKPWDQRLCLVPDGDLFRAIKKGKASVVTDAIDTFTETGLALKSGATLDADLIVSATGLKLLFLGAATIEVDGKEVRPQDTKNYRGAMLSGVPNLAVALGYTNASWTLKCDLICDYVCRLLGHMDKKGYRIAVPRDDGSAGEMPLLDLKSGYVDRAAGHLPKQGKRAPWRLYQNYFLDRVGMKRGSIDDGVLQFTR